jgi:hypothetical protein
VTYALLRGTDLLGRVETKDDDSISLMGILVPRDESVVLRSETQMHVATSPSSPDSVFSMPDEPELLDRPKPPSSTSGGSFALNPVTDDMTVAPKDELRLLKNDAAVPARSVWLHEKRYVDDVPADVQLRLPAGSLRGHSYWQVIAFLGKNGDDGLEMNDGDSWSVAGDEITP